MPPLTSKNNANKSNRATLAHFPPPQARHAMTPPARHQGHKRHRSAASQPAVPTMAMIRHRRPSFPESCSSMSSDDSAMTNDLYGLIDDHLAWQHDARRPGSAGTVFVDWDGYGAPQISYRAEMLYREEAAERWARGVPAWAESRVDSADCCRHAASRARRMSLQDDGYAARPVSRHQQQQFQQPSHRDRRMSLGADHYSARPSSARQQQLFFQPGPPVQARSPHRKQVPSRPQSSRGVTVPFGPAPRPKSSRHSMVQFAEARPNSSRPNSSRGPASPFVPQRPSSSHGRYHAPKSTRSLYVSAYDDDSESDSDGYEYDNRMVHVPQRPATRQSYAAPQRSYSSASSSSSTAVATPCFELEAAVVCAEDMCAKEMPAYDTLTPVIVVDAGINSGIIGLGDSEKTPVIVNEGFDTPITIIGNMEKDLPLLPEEGLNKRTKVKGFVKVVLGRLEGKFVREH
jgi:hypothetical protein